MSWNVFTVLVGIAGLLALVSLISAQTRPLVGVAVLLVCIALLIPK